MQSSHLALEHQKGGNQAKLTLDLCSGSSPSPRPPGPLQPWSRLTYPKTLLKGSLVSAWDPLTSLVSRLRPCIPWLQKASTLSCRHTGKGRATISPVPAQGHWFPQRRPGPRCGLQTRLQVARMALKRGWGTCLLVLLPAPSPRATSCPPGWHLLHPLPPPTPHRPVHSPTVSMGKSKVSTGASVGVGSPSRLTILTQPAQGRGGGC